MIRSVAGKVMCVGRAGLFALLLAAMVAVLLGHATKAYAAPGDLDPSFGSGGKSITDFGSNRFEAIFDIALQEDGKMVVAGYADNGTNGRDILVARFNADGTPDASFGSGGYTMFPFGAGSAVDFASAVAVHPDGKIAVAGYTNATSADLALARLNANGTLDTSFSGDGKVVNALSSSSDFGSDVVFQGNKILVAGETYNGSRTSGGTETDFALLRYDENGNPDTSFGPNGNGVVKTDFPSGSVDAARALTLQADGKIVVAGSTRNLDNTAASVDFALARYDANGNLDTSFGTGGRVVTAISSNDYESSEDVAVQEDGKIVAFGQTSNGSNYDFGLVRYNQNGSLDGEFDFDGKVTTDFGGGFESANGLALQDDGRMVAVGNAGGDLILARYNRDGSLNNAFNDDGRIKMDVGGGSDEGRAVAVQEDGKIVAAGNALNTTSSWNLALVRFFGGNDATPPNTRAPAQSLVTPSTLGASTIPTTISWSATDTDGSVTRYQLQQSIDGAAYQNVNLLSAATTAVTLQLGPARNYRFRVRAADDNGNTSFWKYGPRFTVDAFQESSTQIAYSPTTAWKQQLLSGSYGGQVKSAVAKDATATLSFTGRNVAWVAPKSSAHGQAAVYLDGVRVATVDLYSSRALTRQVVFTKDGLTPSVKHTLQVQLLGTKNASSSATRVDVDAFVVLR